MERIYNLLSPRRLGTEVTNNNLGVYNIFMARPHAELEVAQKTSTLSA